MTAVAGHTGAIYYTNNASSVSMTNEAMTDSGDHTTYTVTNAAHRYWDDTAILTVQTSPDGSTWTTQSSTLYTVQYVGGKIIWNSAQANGTQVRISTGGKYYAYTTFAQGTDWEFDGQVEMLDTTVIGGGRAKSYIPGLLTGKFSMKAFWVDNTFLNNIQTGFRLIFSGSTNGTKRYEAYVYTSADKVKDTVNKTVDEDLEFQVTGAWYYN
jgi:hypothetical protein